MRRYLAFLVLLTFLLFVTMATAQQSSSRESQQSTTTTTTTTTQQNPSSSDQMHDQHSGMSHAKSSSRSGEQIVEGCIIKEESDYFLIPSHGNPIELQAGSGQDLSEHAGHKVKVHGTESALSASGNMGTSATGGTAGTAASSTTTTTTASGAQSSTHSSVAEPAGSSGSSQAGAASGTGNDMHRLATKQMTVVKLDHIASSCPVNWNPSISSKNSSK